VDYQGSKVNVAKVEREFGIDHRAHVELMYPEAKFSYTANDLEVGFKNSVQAYGGSWRYHGKPQLEIESKIVKWVNSGAPVMVELDWGAHSHAMIIVGHEDRNGFVHRWKMQNSWGDRWSDNGSAWYSVEDLRNNLRGAYFVGWGTSQ
jgi:C1A family cysteine protease